MFTIYYEHADCKVQPGVEWTDVWFCACNGECPACGMKDIEPMNGYNRVSHKLRPPFLCPWRDEGCQQVSQTPEEHHAHLRVHEQRTVCPLCGEIVNRPRVYCSTQCRVRWMNDQRKRS